MLPTSSHFVAILALLPVLLQSLPAVAAAAPSGYWVNKSWIETTDGASTLHLTLAGAEVGADAVLTAAAGAASEQDTIRVRAADEKLTLDIGALADGPVTWGLRLVNAAGEAGAAFSSTLAKGDGFAELDVSFDGAPLLTVGEDTTGLAAADINSPGSRFDIVTHDYGRGCTALSKDAVGSNTQYFGLGCPGAGLVELALFRHPEGLPDLHAHYESKDLQALPKLATYTFRRGEAGAVAEPNADLKTGTGSKEQTAVASDPVQPSSYSVSIGDIGRPQSAQIGGAAAGQGYRYRVFDAAGNSGPDKSGSLDSTRTIAFGTALAGLTEPYGLELALVEADGTLSEVMRLDTQAPSPVVANQVRLYVTDRVTGTRDACSASLVHWSVSDGGGDDLVLQGAQCRRVEGQADKSQLTGSVAFFQGVGRYCAFHALRSTADGYLVEVENCLPAVPRARTEDQACLNDHSKVVVSDSRLADQALVLRGAALHTAGGVKIVGGANAASDVHFVADSTVRLMPGFHAEAGGRFSASVLGCSAAARPLARLAQPAAQARGPIEAPPAARPVRVQAPRRVAAAGLPAGLRRHLARLGAEVAAAYADAQGRHWVFASEAPLSPYDQNGVSDVYLYSVAADDITLLSLGRTGAAGNAPSSQPRIDGDGTLAAFVSAASDLVADDRNDLNDVFLFDIQSRTLSRIPRQAAEYGLGHAAHPAFGFNPRLVLFDEQTADGRRDLSFFDPAWPQMGVSALLPEAVAGASRSHPAAGPAGEVLAYLEVKGASCELVRRDPRTGQAGRTACPPEVADPLTRSGGLWLGREAADLKWCFGDGRSPDCVMLER